MSCLHDFMWCRAAFGDMTRQGTCAIERGGEAGALTKPREDRDVSDSPVLTHVIIVFKPAHPHVKTAAAAASSLLNPL